MVFKMVVLTPKSGIPLLHMKRTDFYIQGDSSNKQKNKRLLRAINFAAYYEFVFVLTPKTLILRGATL